MKVKVLEHFNMSIVTQIQKSSKFCFLYILKKNKQTKKNKELKIDGNST